MSTSGDDSAGGAAPIGAEPAISTEAAIAIVLEHAQRGIHYPDALRGKLPLAQAYRVDLGILSHLEALGERHVGWKVGVTARAMQEQVGVREPVFGFLLESGARRSGDTLRLSDLVRPDNENELCLTLGLDLQGPGVTEEAAGAAIATVAPAFEIIERRGVFSEIALSVADNIQQRAFVTGAAVAYDPDRLDLAAVALDLSLDGVHQERAYGREVMGHPVRSIAWLANKLSEFGLGLKAGQRIMSGSFTRQYPVETALEAVAEFAPVGTVRVRFA